MNELTPINKARQALDAAITPKESKQVEALAAAAKAWAKEQNDYESAFDASEIYLMARFKTTELIKPTIRKGQYGRESDGVVTFINDYGFTNKQWNRRSKELESRDVFDNYIDDCVIKRIYPTPYGLVSFYTVKQAMSATVFSSESEEYYTPAGYIEAAREVMGSIDLDPASHEIAQETIRAGRIYTKEDSGLMQEWSGRIWLNPPYGKVGTESSQGHWANYLITEYEAGRVSEAVLLVRAGVGYGWFENLWDEYPVCFARRRLSFTRPGHGDDGQSKQGTALFYFGDNVDKFIEVFTKFGRIILPENQL